LVLISNRATQFCGCASNATPFSSTGGRNASKNNLTNLRRVRKPNHAV
jgi:hypothetical protein